MALKNIGRYQILKRLGVGGFGEVYLGHDAHINRDVAIKVFRPKDENLIAFATSSTEEGLAILRKRFVQEARILAGLENSPYIIPVLDFGELDDGSPYYVMPFLPKSLADEIGKDIFDTSALSELPEDQHPKALDFETALTWLEQIIEGLAAAHSQGLVHRDIKPANILITEEGKIQIVDFGIAKAPDSQQSTVSHLGMGSRNYMAPEQRESAKHVDARADIYSLGILAYRLFTGTLPIGRFPDPNVIQPGLNQALNDLILNLMETHKDKRPADASVVLQAFKQAKSQANIASDPNATSATVVGTPTAKLRDEVMPLKERIEELLLEYGEIPKKSLEELQALSAIADVNKEALKALIQQVHQQNKKAIAPKRNFLKHLDAKLKEKGGHLGEDTLIALNSTAATVGWDNTKVEQLIKARSPKAKMGSESPSARAQKATPTPAQRLSPAAPTKTKQGNSGKAIAAILILALLGGGGYYGYGQYQLDQTAKASEQSAWQQAQTTPSIEAYQRYLKHWPNGAHNSQAKTAKTQLTEQARLAELSTAEQQQDIAKQAQQLLTQLGYKVPTHGQLETRTKKAIEAFEAKRQLSVTGLADSVLLNELKIALKAQQQAEANRLAKEQQRLKALQQAEQVREAKTALITASQRELKRLGYSVSVDGEQGSSTTRAIKAYQKGIKQAVTGEASQSLLSQLKRATKKPGPQPGDSFKDCTDCPEMVVIPAGSFQMGSNEGDADEKPVHRVTISQPFAMGKYEITKGQFASFVAATGYNAGNSCWVYTGSKWEDQSGKNWRSVGFSQSNNDPVVCINWNDATAYAKWLSRKTGKTYRLPSEAEWEYAARARSTTKYSWGDSINCSQASYGLGSCNNKSAKPVGSFKANGFGLYDMHGNVWEWTQDCWHDNYNGAPSNGSAWTGSSCAQRVLRGGSWYDFPRDLRSANRFRYTPAIRDGNNGFRLVQAI